MNQPREICNFDVAVAFVKRLLELKAEQDAEMQLEVVYHWTRDRVLVKDFISLISYHTRDL